MRHKVEIYGSVNFGKVILTQNLKQFSQFLGRNWKIAMSNNSLYTNFAFLQKYEYRFVQKSVQPSKIQLLTLFFKNIHKFGLRLNLTWTVYKREPRDKSSPGFWRNQKKHPELIVQSITVNSGQVIIRLQYDFLKIIALQLVPSRATDIAPSNSSLQLGKTFFWYHPLVGPQVAV